MKRLKRIVIGTLCLATVAVMMGCSSKSDEKVLRVGMECAYAPFNWTQTNDANGAVKIKGSDEYAYGYDVMMAKKIAEKIGYKVEINKMEWDGLVPGVSSGKIDVSIAGQSITAERLQTVDFSDVYYKASIVAITKKGTVYENAKSVQDLKGAICTSQLNTVWYDMLKQIPEADIKPAIDTVPALMVALDSGKANVIVTDKPTAMAAAYSNPNFVVLNFDGDKAFKASDEDVNMGIAIKKGNKELTEKINKALSDITEKERNEMMEEAIKDQPLSK